MTGKGMGEYRCRLCGKQFKATSGRPGHRYCCARCRQLAGPRPSLTPRNMIVFVLYFERGLSTPSIAALYGITPRAVVAILNR